MPDDKEILDPYALVRGEPVDLHILGVTKEYHDQKKADAQAAVEEYTDERDSLNEVKGQRDYTQKAKAALTDASSEEDITNFEVANDTEGQYEGEAMHVVKIKKEEKEREENHQAEITKIDADYATFQNKNGNNAKENRKKYDAVVGKHEEEQKMKADKEEAEEAEAKTAEARIYTLTGILAESDEVVVKADAAIKVIEESKAANDSLIKGMSQIYKPHSSYITEVTQHLEDDKHCMIPTAQIANIKSSSYYWGCRIQDKILAAIERGQFVARYNWLYDTEIKYLLSLGYHVTKVTDATKKDVAIDKEDIIDFEVSWKHLANKADVMDVA